MVDVLRAGVTWGMVLPATFLFAGLIWAIAAAKPSSRVPDGLVRSWARTCLRLAGVKLDTEGIDHVNTDTSYVVVSNHLSGFDIVSHFAALPIPIRFLAKTELFKVPVFGRAMRAIGMIEVNRGAGSSIHEHINATATEAVAKGRSLIIYPEGTRPRDGLLQGFKKGAFTIATAMDLPILPSAITGSREVWAPGSKIIRPGTITVRVMPSIQTAALDQRDVDGLRAEVHEMIGRALSTQH